MMIIDHEFADVATPTGPMRTFLFRPMAAAKYPGILLYSEIFR
jgi:carboxymethylenebutenolidase